MKQTTKVKTNKVRIVVFNKDFFVKAFANKKVKWTDYDRGSIFTRNPDNGRFMSIPFVWK